MLKTDDQKKKIGIISDVELAPISMQIRSLDPVYYAEHNTGRDS